MHKSYRLDDYKGPFLGAIRRLCTPFVVAIGPYAKQMSVFRHLGSHPVARTDHHAALGTLLVPVAHHTACFAGSSATALILGFRPLLGSVLPPYLRHLGVPSTK